MGKIIFIIFTRYHTVLFLLLFLETQIASDLLAPSFIHLLYLHFSWNGRRLYSPCKQNKTSENSPLGNITDFLRVVLKKVIDVRTNRYIVWPISGESQTSTSLIHSRFGRIELGRILILMNLCRLQKVEQLNSRKVLGNKLNYAFRQIKEPPVACLSQFHQTLQMALATYVHICTCSVGLFVSVVRTYL